MKRRGHEGANKIEKNQVHEEYWEYNCLKRREEHDEWEDDKFLECG